MSYATCAYTSGDANSPYVCPATNDFCTSGVPFWGCANAFSTPWLACLDADANTNGGIGFTETLTCSGNAPFCETRLLYIDPGIVGYTNYACGAAVTTVDLWGAATDAPAAGSTASLTPATSTSASSAAGSTSTSFSAGASTITPAPSRSASMPAAKTGAASSSVTSAAPNASKATKGPSLSTSEIIGIVFGVVGAIGGIATVWMCWRLEQGRRERRRQKRLGPNNMIPLRRLRNNRHGVR